MKFYLYILLFSLLSCISPALAQNDNNRIRISMLTCGVGDELYSSFGHTGIRVMDAAKGRDEVYNYGLFNFSDPDFYTKFTRGKLLYFVGVSSYRSFVEDYEYDRRTVTEQELILNTEQKTAILSYLKENLKPENASYKYDFLYDNCATRVRDIFPATLGPDFKFGQVLPEGHKVSFRAIIDQYLRNDHWSRLGINIILGSKIDKVMSNEEAMFLPDMLMRGLQNARLDGQPVAKGPVQLVRGADRSAPRPNAPMWVMIGFLLLTLCIFFLRPLVALKRSWVFLLLMTNGALGVLLLFMWLGTDHQSCANNLNILWAFPLNIIGAFTIFKPKRWHIQYSLLAIILLLLSLLVHIIGIQVMPLVELMPYYIAMLYAYVFIYKNAIATFGERVRSSLA